MKAASSTFLRRLSPAVALGLLFLLTGPPARAQTQPTCEAIGGTCRPITQDGLCESGEQLDKKGTCDSNLKCCGSTSCEDRGGACQPNVGACAPGTSSLGNASCSTGLCCTLPTDGPTCGELVGNTDGRCIQSSDSCPDKYTNLGPTKDPCLSCCSPSPGPGPTPTPTPGGSEYKVEFLHTDALGSVRMVTDETGAVVSRSDYYPFGGQIEPSKNQRGTLDENYVDDPALRQRFTGKERDGETQLDYFGARYYSSSQGRFTVPDAPFADQELSKPQSLNLYGYARNSPMRFVDPTGKGAKDVAKGVALGVVDFALALSPEVMLAYNGAQSLLHPEQVAAANSEFLGYAASAAKNPSQVGAAIADLAGSDRGQESLARIGTSTALQIGVVLAGAGAGSGVRASVSELHSEAIVARGTLSAEVAGTGHPPATVTAAYSPAWGKVVARASRGGGMGCAEVACAEALGHPADIRFTPALRPRTGQQVPVCPACEARFGRSAFPDPTTIFKSDLKPEGH